MNNSGWIRFNRSFLKEPVWQCSTPEQCKILITLLCMANFEPNVWEFNGKVYELKAGQMITSVKKIVEKCNDKKITTRVVRTALNKFVRLKFLTTETTPCNTLISINNWEEFQFMGQRRDKVSTRYRQGIDKAPTTNNNYNNYKNYNNINNNSLDEYKESENRGVTL